MSSSDLSELEPVPGDLVVAKNVMRAWETELVRGNMGAHILKGEQVLVVEVWDVGNQRRMKVIREDRIMVFSNPLHVVRQNWTIAQAVPRFPSSGCP